MTSRSPTCTRRTPAALCWAAVILASAAGCRTATAETALSQLSNEPEHAPAPREASRPRPTSVRVARPIARATPDAPISPLLAHLAELQPRVIVSAASSTFVVLGLAAPDRSGVTLKFAYLAGTDRASATAPGTTDRVLAQADELSNAFQCLTEVAGVREMSVTAIFGAAGEPGLAEEVTFTRGPNGWSGPSRPVLDEIASTPALPARIDRDATGERSAIDVALRFLDDVDREDLDGAWELSSALLKTTMSRAEFEAQLRALPPLGPARRQEAFHTFAPGPFVLGAELDVLFARPGGLEAVVLRLDDAMEWRVFALVTIARRDPSPEFTAGTL